MKSVTTSRSLFILSPPKTATQSVFHSLRQAAPDIETFHAHSLDRARLLIAKREDDTSTDQWKARLSKEYFLLRSLLDTRRMKTVVTVRRDPHSRLWSELFHIYYKIIAPRYDVETDSFDMAELNRRLDKRLRIAVDAALVYPSEVYAPLGIPMRLIQEGSGISRIRDDLEVAVLRFGALAEDFAQLLAHLGLPETPLMHANVARNRSQDVAGVERQITDPEKRLYAAFVRDYPPSVGWDESDEFRRLAA